MKTALQHNASQTGHYEFKEAQPSDLKRLGIPHETMSALFAALGLKMRSYMCEPPKPIHPAGARRLLRAIFKPPNPRRKR